MRYSTVNVHVTRNTFCGTWYLPHSHVHNERTVPIIMAGCMAHAQNSYISTLPFYNLTSPSCSSTPISFKTQKSRRFGHKWALYCVFYCACAKRPYFHFRFKIWRHHRVPRPQFPKSRENFGDSCTFKTDIGVLNICMGFQDFLA